MLVLPEGAASLVVFPLVPISIALRAGLVAHTFEIRVKAVAAAKFSLGAAVLFDVFAI